MTLDSLAVRLAADMGQSWHELCAFPGYARNIWREEARAWVRREYPDAIIECEPDQWDGAEGMCFIRSRS